MLKHHSPTSPDGVCDQIVQQMGGADSFAEEYAAAYRDAKPGGRARRRFDGGSVADGNAGRGAQKRTARI